MRYRRAAAAALCVALAACQHMPESYPPPVQRVPPAGPDIGHLKHFIAMSDPQAEAHFVQDVSATLEGGMFRWSGQKPTFRFALPATANLRLRVDFGINEETFKVTGPVTVSFVVNGKLLDKVTYDAPGEQHFDKPVDESWLRRGSDNIVSMQFDKVWLATDGVTKLGAPLVRIGFLD